MKVLVLASYPIEAACTRYRLHQFIVPLAERGIELQMRPFIDSPLFASLYKRSELTRNVFGLARSTLHRLADVFAARRADALLVQREAMLFGPPLVEWLATRVFGCPMVLDLDDATYVPYTSPTYGSVGSKLKWFGKTDHLIRWARLVTCGNSSIAEYVASKGTPSVIIPTVVDTERFRPVDRSPGDAPLVLGWIGTHSTFSFLETIFPALQELSSKHRFKLKVVGAGEQEIRIPGVEVETFGWSLEREIDDFQSFDIGLYPMETGRYSSEWVTGKSGFKAIQYMSIGIPYVVTPIGACAEIGEVGITHYNATTLEEWKESLSKLMADGDLRRRMGNAGRRHALVHYTVAAQADKLAQALRTAAG